MGFLKDYINDNIELDIKEYMYINVDDHNNVTEYEISDKVTKLTQLNLNQVKLIDFLISHKDLIGMYSSNQTFITKGHNKINHPKAEKHIFNNIDYCEVSINDPVNFLIDNLDKNKDLFFIDVTKLHQFNLLNNGLILSKLEMLDEFFQNERVIRLYKKYNTYFIF